MTNRGCPCRQAGFSYLEALIALGIVVVAMGIALTFFVDLGGAMNTESTALQTQQTGRLVIDEIVRNTRQAGYGTIRADSFNPAVWQRAIVQAGPHTLVFNADADRSVGGLPSTQTVSFPGGTYAGEGAAASMAGAETYLYTIDANADQALTTADRTAAATGSSNPAADTANPYDFAVFRRVYGWNGTDYGGTLEPLAPFLFTNATTDSVYPDGTHPDPLFGYRLTEDLNGDGILQNVECVVGTCPPSPARAPKLYLWGDTDFNGRLSESEKSNLARLVVGSVDWSKNLLVSGGAYKSTTLSVAVSPGTDASYSLKVVDADPFPPGSHIEIDTGAGTERRYVDQVVTTSPEMLLLSTPVANSHPVGTTVKILPQTLLRAIRSIGVTYSAMTGERDIEGDMQAVGRAGRKGTKGLDYKVFPFRREVDVINAPTVAMARGSSPSTTACPLLLMNACSGKELEKSVRFTNLSGQKQFVFKVTDEGGAAVSGIKVTLENEDASLGTLAATELETDNAGLVTATYNMTGTLGTDDITASVTCINGAGVVETDEATARPTLYSINTTLTQDCLGTVSSRVTDPKTPFIVSVTGEDGPVAGQAIDLSLSFDPAYLPNTPDFTALVGGLTVDGVSAGTTNGSGILTPATFSTNNAGQIPGTLGLVTDSGRKGARLQLTTGVSGASCASVAASSTKGVAFFDLALASLSPSSGCTASSPCTWKKGMTLPKVRSTLKINSTAVASTPVTFSTNDVQTPSNAQGPGASLLKPGPNATTDISGQATVKVSNNSATAITALTPLVTKVDVSSPGPAATCTSGAITNADVEAGFRFEDPAPWCRAKMDQNWLSKVNDKKICAHAMNDNGTGGCNQYLKGIRISVYQADGVTLDPTIEIAKLNGGQVSSTVNCGAAGPQLLFEPKCHAENRKLHNGELWNFVLFQTCKIPTTAAAPDKYFVLNNIEWGSNWPKDHKVGIELVYACDGECDTDPTSQTFVLTLPKT